MPCRSLQHIRQEEKPRAHKIDSHRNIYNIAAASRAHCVRARKASLRGDRGCAPVVCCAKIIIIFSAHHPQYALFPHTHTQCARAVVVPRQTYATFALCGGTKNQPPHTRSASSTEHRRRPPEEQTLYFETTHKTLLNTNAQEYNVAAIVRISKNVAAHCVARSRRPPSSTNRRTI